MRLEVSAGLTLKKNKGAEWRLTWGIERKKNEAKTQWLCGCEGQREKRLKVGGKTGRDEDACQYIVKMPVRKKENAGREKTH